MVPGVRPGGEASPILRVRRGEGRTEVLPHGDRAGEPALGRDLVDRQVRRFQQSPDLIQAAGVVPVTCLKARMKVRLLMWAAAARASTVRGSCRCVNASPGSRRSGWTPSSAGPGGRCTGPALPHGAVPPRGSVPPDWRPPRRAVQRTTQRLRIARVGTPAHGVVQGEDALHRRGVSGEGDGHGCRCIGRLPGPPFLHRVPATWNGHQIRPRISRAQSRCVTLIP